MSILLVGYRGSGKTTVGQLLAAQLGKPFVDLDQRIIALAGKSIKDIFAQHGEQHFRDLETRALLEAIRQPDQVIAVGGGALDRKINRDAIKAGRHRVVYLRCAPPELLRRIVTDPGTAANRPNLTAHGGGLAEIRAVLARREPRYRASSHFQITVTHKPPAKVAIKLVHWYRQPPRP